MGTYSDLTTRMRPEMEGRIMKCLNEKDYKYVGVENNWLKFTSQPKVGFDPEILLIQRVRFNKKDGSSILLTAAKGDKMTARA